MKRIKLVVFFILGLFLLTSCNGLSHERFPSGPQIDDQPGQTPGTEVSSYLLTYYENGLKVHQEKLEKGAEFELISSTKTPIGYEFIGWSTSSEEYLAVDFDEMPEEDVDLYAFYQKAKYTITFNANIDLPEGTTTSSEYEYLERLGSFVPADLQEVVNQAVDYVFVGWYLDPLFQEAFTEVSMPDHDITLYAKWQFSGVVFMNGLETFYEVKGDEGDAINAPLQTPSKVGYDFVGWVDENSDAVEFPMVLNDEVQYVFASYTPKTNIPYKVEHYLENLNGTFVRYETVDYLGSTDAIVEASWKSYTGFTKDEEHENNVLSGIVTHNGSLVLKLYYSRNSYQVSYNTNGGSSINTDTYKYEQAFTSPSAPTKLGYTFAGWKLNGVDYKFGTMPAENITLEASWQVVVYTVTFVAAEVVGKVNYTVENKNIVEPAVPQIDHFTGDWEHYELTTGNVTVKAVYTANPYTVTFKAEGVVVGTDTYTVVDRTVTEPTVPTKAHYKGVWETYVLTSGDRVINAVYTPVTYTVTYKAQGSADQVKYYTIENTTVVAPAVPTKEHYVGVWESCVINGGNKVINAIYTPVTYTVTFMNGLDVVGTDTYTVEDKEINIPAVPTKAHYTGVWESYTLNGGNKVVNPVYTPVTYTVTFKADGETIEVKEYNVENLSVTEPDVPAKTGYSGVWESYTLDNGNKVVNAIYTPKQYTISFNTNGGNELASITKDFGEEVSLPTPTKQYHTFVSWQLDGIDYTTATMPAENITLTASWREWLEVNYVLNGGNFTYASLADVKAAFDVDYQALTGQTNYSEWKNTASLGNVFTQSNDKWDWLLSYWAAVNTNSYNDTPNKTVFDRMRVLGTCDDYYYFGVEITAWYTSSTKSVYAGGLKSANYADVLVQDAWWQYYSNVERTSDRFDLSMDLPTIYNSQQYKFAGWYDNPEFTGNPITEITSSTTVYAKWVVNEFTIDYELNGGQFELYSGSPIGEISTTSNKSYWSYYQTDIFFYNSSNAINAQYSYRIELTENVDGKLEVTGIGEYNTTTLTFDGTYLIVIAGSYNDYQSTAALRSAVKVGMYATVDGDIEQGIVDVKFYESNQHNEIIDTFNYHELPTTLPTPKKDGYSFIGWTEVEDGNEIITELTELKNTTLYAKWAILESVHYELNGGNLTYSTFDQIKADFDTDYRTYTGQTNYSQWKNSAALGNVFTQTNGKWNWLLDYWAHVNTNSYDGVTNASVFNTMKVYGTCADYYFFGVEITSWYNNQQLYVYAGELLSADYTDEAVRNQIWHFIYLNDCKTDYFISGSNATLPNTAYKNDYVFAGWYDNPEFTGSPITEVSTSTTVYAKWNPIEYTITFNTDGGSQIDAITLPRGSQIVAPNNPTKAGYSFAGWSPALPNTLQSDLTVTALWEELETAQISFATTENRVSQTTTSQVWASSGITFTNNKASSSSNVANYSNPVRCYKGSDIVISYPNLIYEIKISAVSGYAFLAGDSISGARLVVDGTTATIVLDTPATSFTISTLPRQIRINSLTIGVDELLPSGTVSFNKNGGTGSVESITGLNGESIEVPSILGITAPSGKQFKCWNTKADETGTTYLPGETIVINGDLELFAIWEDEAIAEVTIAEAKELLDGRKVILKGTVVSIDTAWSEQYGNITVTLQDTTGTITLFRLATKVEIGDIITVTGTMTTYSEVRQVAAGATAEITGVILITVSYDANGGTGSLANHTVSAREQITLLDGAELVAPAGQMFKAWATSSNGSGTLYEAGESAAFYEDTVLYAIWMDIPTGNEPVLIEKTYSYTFEGTQFTANGTKSLGDVNWTISGDGGYWGYSATKGQQLGSAGKPYKSLTVLSGSEFTNISQIVINTSGASSIKGTLTVYVGDTQVDSITLTATATNYTIDLADLTGAIKLVYSQTSSKALYIKSITVNYAVEE